MKIASHHLAPLAPMLNRLEALEAECDELSRRGHRAQDVLARLDARLAELDREMTEPLIQPDRSRVERLLAGDNPAMLDASEVEARNMRNRALGAEKAQIAADAEAVRAEATGIADQLKVKAGEWSAELTKLLHAFAEAATDSYVEAADAFVRDSVMPMEVACRAMGSHAGQPVTTGRMLYTMQALRISYWPKPGNALKPIWPLGHDSGDSSSNAVAMVRELIRQAGAPAR